MSYVTSLKKMVLEGYLPNEEEGMHLAEENTDELASAASELRRHFTGEKMHLCAIVNAKNGCCGEDCKFCAQSRLAKNALENYKLLPPEEMAEKAVSNYKDGMERFAFVTSGRALTDYEVETLCEACRLIRQKCSVKLCASSGLLTYNQLQKLHNAGITRYHCNLETSRRFFPNICTTHTYDEKIQTIKNAKAAGMEICSGGIIGLGENMRDRIEMVLTQRALGVSSVPVNVLNPIPGTPFEKNARLSYDEIRKTISVFRFLLPKAEIRFAGGRILTPDKGRLAIKSGLNALISGNMLTISGIGAKDDIKIAKELGFET